MANIQASRLREETVQDQESVLEFENLNALRESLFDPQDFADGNEKSLVSHVVSHLKQASSMTDSFRAVDKPKYKILFDIFERLSETLRLKQPSAQLLGVFADFVSELVDEENLRDLRALSAKLAVAIAQSAERELLLQLMSHLQKAQTQMSFFAASFLLGIFESEIQQKRALIQLPLKPLFALV